MHAKVALFLMTWYCAMLMRGRVSARVNLTADRLLLLEMENKYLNVFPPSHCPMRRTTRTEQEIMDSLDACVDSDELLNKMIVKVQDALERVVSFIKIHGSSTTLSRMQLRRLQRYRNQLHGDNFISVFTCPICSIKSITFIGLWKHMSGLHNIYLRAKGMLSTIIAKDTFITPRKLIIKRKRVNATQADGAGVSETVRRMLRKIRRKVTTLTTSTEAPTMPMVERKRKMAHDVVGEIMQKWAMRHAMGQNETMRINKDVQKEWQRFRHMG